MGICSFSQKRHKTLDFSKTAPDLIAVSINKVNDSNINKNKCHKDHGNNKEFEFNHLKENNNEKISNNISYDTPYKQEYKIIEKKNLEEIEENEEIKEIKENEEIKEIKLIKEIKETEKPEQIYDMILDFSNFRQLC